ncbi:hypothetical protein BATDEDRAFT_87832 [Batrachochytrium dendrobatidis JAM81]|uniref:Uncharacterized protein n=1 Tax=Batrachochytrium dendrobatidis (strain JAM81 / FGSC 10211) TaxID=684364 RepID=F4NZZ9_BATDJ|nr:uncharacterized protein BATDEDRAFT_87832 [Batrachochytrium dendrobatidis JAM81]EGF81177.1 hypothetical protein BATDEDRAFT_87832 [Batrachochytrium dendrobatidis JAM81]|eukprot:XP_006678110.1 hypothetical protein BATDEDRAFT_87832 [Batrachochytrium dendrobatidis JAM81]
MKINVLSCLFLAATAKAMILSSSSDSISILEKRQTPPNEPNPSTSQQSHPSTSQQSSQNGAKPKSHFPEGPFGHILDGAPPLRASDLGYDDDGTPLDEGDPRCKELSTAERCYRAAHEMTLSAIEDNKITQRKIIELKECQETLEQMKLCLNHKRSSLGKIKSTISRKSSIRKSCQDITLEKVKAQHRKCRKLDEEVEEMMEKERDDINMIQHYKMVTARLNKS